MLARVRLVSRHFSRPQAHYVRCFVPLPAFLSHPSLEYRSAIFYHTPEQEQIAKRVTEEVQKKHFDPVGACTLFIFALINILKPGVYRQEDRHTNLARRSVVGCRGVPPTIPLQEPVGIPMREAPPALVIQAWRQRRRDRADWVAMYDMAWHLLY